MKRILSPSLLSADFVNLRAQLDELTTNKIENLHFDVMDGMFVPSISFGMPILKSIRKYSDMILDVHMMVVNPERYVEDMAASGADIITIHEESCIHLDRTLNQIKNLGLKAGVALNPATNINSIEEILPLCDVVLLMSVNPGFGGQKYIPYVTQKIKKLREIIYKNGYNTSIQVDGGITLNNINEILDAGADNVVAGSSVFNGDLTINIKKFTDILKEYN